jgi:hypothetical protein
MNLLAALNGELSKASATGRGPTSLAWSLPRRKPHPKQGPEHGAGPGRANPPFGRALALSIVDTVYRFKDRISWKPGSSSSYCLDRKSFRSSALAASSRRRSLAKSLRPERLMCRLSIDMAD